LLGTRRNCSKNPALRVKAVLRIDMAKSFAAIKKIREGNKIESAAGMP